MPELDGVTIFALASFAALVVGWLVAPSEAISHVRVARATQTPVAEPIAA